MAPLTTVTSGGILDGTIVNADVDASAAIALSKLASHPSVLTGSTSNTIPIVTGANALSGQANLQFNGSGDLTVIGNEGVSANLYLRADEGDDNGDGWRIGSNQDTNDLTFANNTSGSYVDKLTLLKTGEVGINTSTPAAFLEISAGSSGTDVNVLRLDSAGGGAFNIQCSDASSGTPLWKFDLGISEALQIDSATTTRFISGSGDSSIAIGKTGAANDAVVIKYDESGDKLHFYGWGGSEGDILTLDNGNSRVGIGVTSPNCALQITDTTSHTAYAQAAPSATACMLQLFNNPSSEATNNHASLQFGVNGGTQNRVGSISAVAEDSGNRKLALAFCTDSGSNRSERIRITGDGKLGIGTTSPTGNLEIDTASTTEMIMLDVSGTNFAQIGHNSASGVAILDVRSEGHMRFLTNGNNERLRIDSAGMTGVRTAVPRATLHVKAHDNAWESGLLLEDNTGDDGWNLHPDSSDTSLMIGYNDDVTTSLTSQSATPIVRFRSAGGICFGADSAAANALDDYEEGTWTPTLVVTGNSSANVTLNDGGTYTKVGRHVYARAYITLTSKGSGASASAPVFLGGLPFTATSGHSAGAVHYWHNTPTDYVYVTGTVQSNSVNFLIRMATAAHDQASNMRFDGIQDGSSFIYSVSYEV